MSQCEWGYEEEREAHGAGIGKPAVCAAAGARMSCRVLATACSLPTDTHAHIHTRADLVQQGAFWTQTAFWIQSTQACLRWTDLEIMGCPHACADPHPRSAFWTQSTQACRRWTDLEIMGCSVCARGKCVPCGAWRVRTLEHVPAHLCDTLDVGSRTANELPRTYARYARRHSHAKPAGSSTHAHDTHTHTYTHTSRYFRPRRDSRGTNTHTP